MHGLVDRYTANEVQHFAHGNVGAIKQNLGCAGRVGRALQRRTASAFQ